MEYIWDYVEKKAYNNRTGRYKTKVQYDFILENGKDKTQSILDIAGGAGRFAVPLQQYSQHITVLDINQKAIQLLNERHQNIKTLCGDFSQIQINDKFSLVLCIEALPYFSDWKAFFLKINSLMEDDGRFIFTYTNPNSWRYSLRKFTHKLKDKPNAYTDMNFTEFVKLLSDCGLEIEKKDGMNWVPFGVNSDNPLVSFFVFIERTLGLHNWHSQSPWLLISLKKRKKS